MGLILIEQNTGRLLILLGPPDQSLLHAYFEMIGSFEDAKYYIPAPIKYL